MEHQITILSIDEITKDECGVEYRKYMIPPQYSRYDCYYLFDDIKCYSELLPNYVISTIPDKKEIYDNLSLLQKKIYDYLKERRNEE